MLYHLPYEDPLNTTNPTIHSVLSLLVETQLFITLLNFLQTFFHHFRSLFTAIPVDRACEHIRNKLFKDETLQHRTKLSIDDIIRLLRLR